jgi:hypothetical protein
MKRSLLVLFSTFFVAGFAQEANTWRLGIQLGSEANHSIYSGGMAEANARFNHNPFGAGALSVVGRYDFDNHWMVSAGLGLSAFGFEYSISEDYSLLAKNRKFTTINSSFGVLETPVMVHYKFNPNCKNTRWIVGAGIAQYLTGAATIDKNVSQATDGNTSVNYISSTSTTQGGFMYSLRWSVGREKTFKNNGILNASLLFNLGLSQFATSTVNYTIDNQNYTHSFTNNGNFIGVRLTYFFRPFVNPWEVKK